MQIKPLQALSLSAGKYGGQFISGSVILILDANGTPIAGFEQLNSSVTIVCTHKDPEAMNTFLARHDLPFRLNLENYQPVG